MSDSEAMELQEPFLRDKRVLFMLPRGWRCRMLHPTRAISERAAPRADLAQRTVTRAIEIASAWDIWRSDSPTNTSPGLPTPRRNTRCKPDVPLPARDVRRDAVRHGRDVHRPTGRHTQRETLYQGCASGTGISTRRCPAVGGVLVLRRLMGRAGCARAALRGSSAARSWTVEPVAAGGASGTRSARCSLVPRNWPASR